MEYSQFDLYNELSLLSEEMNPQIDLSGIAAIARKPSIPSNEISTKSDSFYNQISWMEEMNFTWSQTSLTSQTEELSIFQENNLPLDGNCYYK